MRWALFVASEIESLLAAMTNHRRCGDIIVRPFSSGDASALYATVRNSIASLSSMFSWCHPDYTITEAEARVAHCMDAWERKIEFPFGVFSTHGPELLGCVGLNQINEAFRSANLGYWVGEAYRCRGIAARAASLVASIGFEELSFVRLEIVTLPQNFASQRVAEKVGATREAEARNRLMLQGRPTAAVVYSLVPEDMVASKSIQRNTPAGADVFRGSLAAWRKPA
jgi:ribosomal-protein-serine acetyltransferase